MPGNLGIDFRLAFEFVPQAIDLVHDDEPGAACTMNRGYVLTPDFNVGPGDAGVGRQQKEHGMRVGQHGERQFGLGADGVEPGRVEYDQALLEQRVGEVDEGMTPARNGNAAVLRQCAGGFLVGRVDEPVGFGRAGIDRHGVGKAHQGGAHLGR